MVIPSLAAGALEQFRIVRVEVEDHPRVQDGATTALAGHAERAAGHGREDVVGVHGAQDQGFPRPLLLAGLAPDSVGSLQAPHADGV